MGMFDKFKTKPATTPMPNVTVPQTAPSPMAEGHFDPILTLPDTQLVGPHVYSVPLERLASQTISHKGLTIDWTVFGPWLGEPTAKPVRRKFWVVPVDDGTVEFWIPRKIQIGYSRREQGRELHDAIRILEAHVHGPMRVESFGYITVKWDDLDEAGNPTWNGSLAMARPHQGMFGTWKSVKAL